MINQLGNDESFDVLIAMMRPMIEMITGPRSLGYLALIVDGKTLQTKKKPCCRDDKCFERQIQIKEQKKNLVVGTKNANTNTEYKILLQGRRML